MHTLVININENVILTEEAVQSTIKFKASRRAASSVRDIRADAVN